MFFSEDGYFFRPFYKKDFLKTVYFVLWAPILKRHKCNLVWRRRRCRHSSAVVECVLKLPDVLQLCRHILGIPMLANQIHQPCQEIHLTLNCRKQFESDPILANYCVTYATVFWGAPHTAHCLGFVWIGGRNLRGRSATGLGARAGAKLERQTVWLVAAASTVCDLCGTRTDIVHGNVQWDTAFRVVGHLPWCPGHQPLKRVLIQ